MKKDALNKSFAASAWTWMLVGLVTILFSLIVFFVWLLAFPFDRQRRSLHRCAAVWAKIILVVCPVMRVHLKVETDLSAPKPYIFIANHQSLADILVTYYLPHNFKFLAKQELFWIPFFGWGMALTGYIPLIRGNKESSREAVLRAKTYLRNGMSVLFFPEGTRSVTGEIQEFRPGAFKLAVELGIPVIPVIINGTKEVLVKGSFLFPKKCVLVDAIVKPPLVPDEDSPGAVDRLQNRVRENMKSCLNEMRTGERLQSSPVGS